MRRDVNNRRLQGAANKRSRELCASTALAAVVFLSAAAGPLHAEDSDLKKEVEILKAQVNAQKGQINTLVAAIKDQRVETRRNKDKIKVVADRSYAPPFLEGGRAPGYTSGGFQPIGGYDDKKLHFGGITITPGGYFGAGFVYRTRNTNSDIASTWTIPMHNVVSANTREYKGSVRPSRGAVLVEANVTPSILTSGYFEGDFLGLGTNSNYNNNDSFVPRIRHLYANVDFLESGIHLLAGQAFSLAVLNSKGITPRNEIGAPTIENTPWVGEMSARQAQFRLTKDFDKKLWLSVSAEMPQTTFGGSGCGNIVGNSGGAAISQTSATTGGAVTCLAIGGAGYAQTGQAQQLSLNQMPDVIGKAAYEAKIADRDVHFEAFGMYRNFYDRVDYGAAPPYTTAVNYSRNGYGIGGGIVASIIPKRLDFSGTVVVGRGISRYGGVGLNDATLDSVGAVKPLYGTDLFGVLTFHATPTLDFYGVAGYEKLDASYQGSAATGYIGYGAPNAAASGCNIEGSAACSGNTHNVYALTVGMWDKVYQGSYGELRAGVEYAYARRELFTSSAGPGGSTVTPSASDNQFYAMVRYYPF